MLHRYQHLAVLLLPSHTSSRGSKGHKIAPDPFSQGTLGYQSDAVGRVRLEVN